MVVHLTGGVDVVGVETNFRRITGVLEVGFAQHILTGLGIGIQLLGEVIVVLAQRLPAARSCGVINNENVAVRGVAGDGQAIGGADVADNVAVQRPVRAIVEEGVLAGYVADRRAEGGGSNRAVGNARTIADGDAGLFLDVLPRPRAKIHTAVTFKFCHFLIPFHGNDG